MLETTLGGRKAVARGELFCTSLQTKSKCLITDIGKATGMEKLFTGLVTALSVPILILNVLGGIIGGIWLMISGEWTLFLSGLGYMAFGAMLLGLLLMPGLLFGAPAAVFAEKRKYVLFGIFGSLSLVYTYGLIVITTYFVADWILSFSSAPLWAALLWLYATVLAPWQYMASKEQDNSSTTMTTFFLALGVFVLILLIGVFGLTLAQAFPVLVAILSVSALLQLISTVLTANAGRKATVIDPVEWGDSEENHVRTWEDIK